MRGGSLTHGVAFGAVVAVALAASVWSPGAKEHPLATWPMIGHDVENSRSQPDEGSSSAAPSTGCPRPGRS